jgi:hypothetical protein
MTSVYDSERLATAYAFTGLRYTRSSFGRRA